MTCRCGQRDAAACLRERAPWLDSDDDARAGCTCICHGMAIDLARADLDDDGPEGMAAE